MAEITQEMIDAYAQTPMGVLSDRVSNVARWTSDQQQVINELVTTCADLKRHVLALEREVRELRGS